MEDQSADSGDLTTDAATASVPQGKVARSRHRLPRQKARQLEQHEAPTGDDAAQETEALTTESATAETVEQNPAADDGDTPADQTAVAETTVVPAPKLRRRGRWRRTKVTEEPVETTAGEDTGVADTGVTDDADEPVANADADADSASEVLTDGDPEVLTDSAPEVLTDGDPEVLTDGDEPEPALVPHRTAGRTLKAVAIAAAVLFVAAGAFAGATVQPYLADRAAVFTKFEIAETAANAITTLWTYTPDDMDKLPERSAKYLGGDFAADYRRYIDAIVAPNKQAQITNSTQVLGAAVESLTPTEATAIVYTNSVATSPVTKGIPSLRYLSYRLSMKRDGSRWLITQMVAVTKLDLTPRL